MYDVIAPEYKSQIEVAIQQALLGAPATVQYKIKGRKGYVDVVTSESSPLQSRVRFVPDGACHLQNSTLDTAMPKLRQIRLLFTSVSCQFHLLLSDAVVQLADICAISQLPNERTRIRIPKEQWSLRFDRSCLHLWSTWSITYWRFREWLECLEQQHERFPEHFQDPRSP